MKKFVKTLKLIGINLVVFILLFELIALSIYFFQHKTFFYTDKQGRIKPGLTGPDEGEDRRLTQLTDKRFHPFFGYTYHADAKNTNNYGFLCPFDYPLRRESKNWFIIGIFGGSVADDFYRDGTQRLTEKLQAHPALAGKEIICLNYAMGGYKQPQQMEILTYFLAVGQELDIAINIDGFNEMVFGFNNNRLNVDIGMPSAQHFLPMRDLIESRAMTGQQLESAWKIRQYKRNLAGTQHFMENTPLAAVYLVSSAYYNYLHKKYRREILRFDQLIKPARARDSIVNIKYTPAIRAENLLMAKIAALWSQCSSVMSHAMTAQKGETLYFHFLQPNQYDTKKIFTPEERKNALDNHLAYALLVKKGYPVLRQEVAALRNKGVLAFSAVEVFDNVKETVYIDNCCHFNRLGSEIFAEFIAACILPHLGPGT